MISARVRTPARVIGECILFTLTGVSSGAFVITEERVVGLSMVLLVIALSYAIIGVVPMPWERRTSLVALGCFVSSAAILGYFDLEWRRGWAGPSTELDWMELPWMALHWIN